MDKKRTATLRAVLLRWVGYLLQLCLPQTVQVAVLIYCHWLAAAGADNSLWLILEVDADAAIFGLNIDKGDVVLWEHWVWYATHLNLY